MMRGEQLDEAAYDPGHDCHDHAVEHATTPTRSGNLTVWEECDLCGRTTTPPYADSIF